MKLTVGIDIGQATDHTAVCAVERVKLAVPVFRRKFRYVVRLLDEYPLGVDYPEQVRRMCATLGHPAFKGARCGVDYTGVGRPVYDLLKQARPPVLLYPVLTTGGHAITYDEATREYHLPKAEQVGLLQVLLQADLLGWHAKLATGPRLEQQLLRYRVRQTKAKNETFGAETGTNDDLVSAVMTACWLGEHTGCGDPSGITVPDGADGSVTDAAPAGVFL